MANKINNAQNKALYATVLMQFNKALFYLKYFVKKNLMICSILSQINVVIYTCKNDNNDELDI